MERRDIIFLIVIVVLVLLLLSTIGIVPLEIPGLSKVKVITKVVPTTKTLVTTKLKTLRPKTVTKLVYINISSPTTILKTATITRVKTLTVRSYITLTKTTTLTRIINKTYTIIKYPKEELRRVITLFIAPGDEILVGLSNLSTQLLSRRVYLLASFSDYDINLSEVLCTNAECTISRRGLDINGGSLKVKFKGDKAKVTLIPSRNLDVGNGVFYIFISIPYVEKYNLRIDERTFTAIIEEPIIKSPIIKFQLRYFAEGHEAIAKPLRFTNIGYDWYLIMFRVRGVGINNLTLLVSRYVLFIRDILLDKMFILHENLSSITVHIAPPITTLLNLLRKNLVAPLSCNGICVYKVPTTWFILLRDSLNNTIGVNTIEINYTVTVSKDKERILSITPPEYYINITIPINIEKYIRTLPGLINVTLIMNLEIK